MNAGTIAESPVEVSGIWSRRRLNVAFTAFGWFWGGWGATLPAIQQRVGVTDGQLGLILLGTVVGALVSMRALAGTIERLGPAAVRLSLVAVAALVVPLAASRSAPVLVAWLCLFGVASGVVDVSVNAGGAALERIERVPVLPVTHGCFAFGVLGGGLVSGLLRQAGLSPVGVMTVVAVVLLAAAIVPAHPAANGLSAGTEPPLTPGTTPGPAGTTPDMTPGPASGTAPYPAVLSRRSLARLGALCALSFLIEDALQNWGSVHLEHTFHARPAISGLAPAMFGLAAGLTRVTLPRWSRRQSPTRIVSWGGLLAAAGLLLAALSPYATLAIAGVALAGVGLAGVAPLLMGIAGASGATRAVSIVSSVAYLGFVLGPPLTGGVAGLAGLRVAFTMLAGVAVVLGVMAGRTPAERGD